jgi:hypothetical protein
VGQRDYGNGQQGAERKQSGSHGALL